MRKRAPENLREHGKNNREKASTMTFKTLEVDEMFQPKEFDYSSLLYTLKNLDRQEFLKKKVRQEKWSSSFHFDDKTDSAFYFTCIKANKKKHDLMYITKLKKHLYLKATKLIW